jgi:hypothetical protein
VHLADGEGRVGGEQAVGDRGAVGERRVRVVGRAVRPPHRHLEAGRQPRHAGRGREVHGGAMRGADDHRRVLPAGVLADHPPRHRVGVDATGGRHGYRRLAGVPRGGAARAGRQHTAVAGEHRAPAEVTAVAPVECPGGGRHEYPGKAVRAQDPIGRGHGTVGHPC